MIEKHRESLIEILKTDKVWDVLVIGGGATGFGVALEAATRGYQTLLLERGDFAGGTSSRSTKLVHGGVRYLRQGDISLVRTALAERQRMLQNAPAVTRKQPFIIPVYSRWDKLFYGIGLKVYDLLAGRKNIGHSCILSRAETRRKLQAIRETPDKPIQGGILYYDGQFDDSRMIVAMLDTLFRVDGRAINYVEVTGLLKNQGLMSGGSDETGSDSDAGSNGETGSNGLMDKDLARSNDVAGSDGNVIVTGVTVKDLETGNSYKVRSRAVINAAGIFADEVRGLDNPEAEPMIRTSQGVHLVLDRSFHPGESAIMIPKTEDGRVLFAVPWHDKVILGTTDTPVNHKDADPRALPEEIEYLLSYAGKYLKKAPTRADVRSVYAGLRPLIGKGGKAGRGKTSSLSRDHTLFADASGLITITGGKWTTWRHMGEETMDLAEKTLSLQRSANTSPHTTTKDLFLEGGMLPGDVGRTEDGKKSNANDHSRVVRGDVPFHTRIPITPNMVKSAVCFEMARTVEDVLARRTRCLFLDAKAATEVADAVANCLAYELGKDTEWAEDQAESFRELAKTYQL